MKLQIIKETETGENPWYILQADGKHIKGSYTLDNIIALYKEIKETSGDCLKVKREILASEEVDVNLDYIFNKPI